MTYYLFEFARSGFVQYGKFIIRLMSSSLNPFFFIFYLGFLYFGQRSAFSPQSALDRKWSLEQRRCEVYFLDKST